MLSADSGGGGGEILFASHAAVGAYPPRGLSGHNPDPESKGSPPTGEHVQVVHFSDIFYFLARALRSVRTGSADPETYSKTHFVAHFGIGVKMTSKLLFFYLWFLGWVAPDSGFGLFCARLPPALPRQLQPRLCAATAAARRRSLGTGYSRCGYLVLTDKRHCSVLYCTVPGGSVCTWCLLVPAASSGPDRASRPAACWRASGDT